MFQPAEPAPASGSPSDPEFDVSVVIPVFNQAHVLKERLPRILEYLASSTSSSEVVIVSDGSVDRPAESLSSFLEGTRVPCRLIEYTVNRGKGFAIRTGFRASSGRFVLFSDADFSTPIEELAGFLDEADRGADVVIGSRRHEQTRIEIPQPWSRQFSGSTFGRLVQALTGLNTPDTQCGFKLIRRAALIDRWEQLVEDRFAFDVELLSLAREANLRVSTVGVRWDDAPESTVRLLRDSSRTLHGVLLLGRSHQMVWLRQLRLFGSLGIAAVAVAALASPYLEWAPWISLSCLAALSIGLGLAKRPPALPSRVGLVVILTLSLASTLQAPHASHALVPLAAALGLYAIRFSHMPLMILAMAVAHASSILSPSPWSILGFG